MSAESGRAATDLLLRDEATRAKLSATEESRVPIPADKVQDAAREIGTLVGHDMPVVGEDATLQFPSGRQDTVEVTGYDKDFTQVNIPSANGGVVASNIDNRAMDQLTRETR